MTDDRLEIWIDDACGVCRRSRDWCLERDAGARLTFLDLEDGADNRPGTPSAMDREIHARRDDGVVLTGYDAVVAILAGLPGWSPVAWALGRPPLSWIGPTVYRAVARWRHRISRMLPP
jgi:predicted DCC family thiol-disulfide oxidoreductase YuxK